jgi:hypothetical protein
MRVFVFAIVLALAIAGLALAPSTAADEPCPPGTHPVYDIQGELLSCEEEVGAPESCPDWTLPGYLANGELAGCFERSMYSWYEICYPDDVDTDGDGRGDACDPCPNDPDCDGDGWEDSAEVYIGTDPLDNCPDGADDDAWPPDINMDTVINVLDLFAFVDAGVLGCAVGDPCYDARFDLNVDGNINVLDLYALVPLQGTQCMGAGVSELGAGVPELGAGVPELGGQWSWWLPLEDQTVHQHSVHRWCWWDLEQGWWQCQDKYWIDLVQTFYWSELGAVTVGPHTVDYGAVDPFLFVEGDTWYEQSIYSATHVRGLAGMEVWALRGGTWVHYPAETWVDYYESRPYEAGESGFLSKGALNKDDVMGHYSYGGGSGCGSDDDWVDPISVVFYGGNYSEVEYHACDHGSWCFHSGDTQMFWSHGCWDQDGQANSASPAFAQYHMRILTGRYWDGTYAYDPVLGVYNLTTPHHEQWETFNPACGTSMHSVDDNEMNPPGGFVMARRDIMKNWVEEGPHKWSGYQYWDNDEVMTQSAGKGLYGLEGCWQAWNDGKVAFISLEHE